jgi:hypothetical protein
MTSPDNLMSFHNITGGFDLLQVVKNEPLHVEVVVKERKSDHRGFGTLDVKQGDPAQVVNMSWRLIPPGASVSDFNFTLDAAGKARVINAALAKLNEF